MTLPELSIRRPVLTMAVSMLATIAGIIGLSRLPVREYPAIDPPTLSLSTTYAGAAAEIVEAQITEPLEAAINTVSGIKSLRSQSREGGSQISVEFSLDTNLEAAASDVRDQVARIARQLPEDVDSPVVNKADADSQPIFGLSISSDRRSQLELGAYADTLRERLQTVPGIAGVMQPAEKRYAMRLWIDAEKLRAYGLSPLDVRAAVNRENVELPSGRIEGRAVELAVKTMSRIDTPAEFDALVIKRVGDRVVRFGDVGRAELGAQNERGALKMGDQPIAGLYFRPQAGANQIEIVDELRRRLAQIQREVPDDIKVEVAYDNTEYVRRSLLEVSETIVIAFALVVLVVFAFLREWRTTLIPVIAIPVSIVGAFGIMAAAGFSINTLTLLGIVLSIGLVVDDAIVVLENIYAKVEKGQAPIAAAIAGTNEVFTAVVATTIALVVVFLPLLFICGHLGAAVPRVRHDDLRRGADLRRGRAHAHADADLAAAEGAAESRQAVRANRAAVHGPRPQLRRVARGIPAPARGGAAAADRVGRRDLCDLRYVAARARAARGSRPRVGACDGARGRELRLHATVHGRRRRGDRRAGARGARHDDAGAGRRRQRRRGRGQQRFRARVLARRGRADAVAAGNRRGPARASRASSRPRAST